MDLRRHLFLISFSLVLFVFAVKINNAESAKQVNDVKDDEYPLLTAKLYAEQIFKDRRKEHIYMVKHLLKNKYERNYKLLSVTYGKIFEVLKEQNATLFRSNYEPLRDGFPEEDPLLQGAVQLILENCCLAAEILLHFPEMSYRIFKDKGALTAEWHATLNYCITFIQDFPHIIDEPTAKLMDLLDQEINEDSRTTDYINPYYQRTGGKDTHEKGDKATTRRKKKRLKKGPHLTKVHGEL